MYCLLFYHQSNLKSDITSLTEAIRGLSSTLAEDDRDSRQAITTLASKYEKISNDLEFWKRYLIDSIDEVHRNHKAQLEHAHKSEKERLKKGYAKRKEALQMSEKLVHIAKHLRLTGNQRDLQNLKDNMTENVDALNLLLDERIQRKRTCAEAWSYTKPNLQPDSFSYLLGKLNIQTFDVSQSNKARSGGTSSSESRDSPLRQPPSNISSVENLMTKLESARLEEKYKLLHSFSSKTYNDKARCHPVSFTLDWMGNIVVADKYNNKIKVFTERGQLVQEITSQYLRSPSGIAMTPEGNIAVSDSQMSDVKVFNSQGDLLFYYQRAMTPAGVAFNKQGELLVTDTGMKAVLIYDNRNWSHPRRILRDVTLLGAYPNQRKEMWYPHYVAVNSVDDIYISDRTAHSLHVLDKDGHPIHGFGERYNLAKRFAEPYGITVDNTNNILVADYGSNSIVTIGPDHEFKAPILDKRHDLKFPTNIIVSVDGKLLVSEYLSGDIKVFGTQGMIDDIANEADDELPPAYDALGASAPLVNPTVMPQAPVSEDASLETTI